MTRPRHPETEPDLDRYERTARAARAGWDGPPPSCRGCGRALTHADSRREGRCGMCSLGSSREASA